LGIIALFHIKKTNLKGKWFAILAIIMGLHGFLSFRGCGASIF